MTIQSKIVDAAEELFDRNGFTATGMDRITQAAQVSSRTLYKHLGDKTGLVAAVLSARHGRFSERLDVRTVEALFEALEDWIRIEGANGCLFLRAFGESGDREPKIAHAVRGHKEFLRTRIRDIVEGELGEERSDIAEQVLILFEGATATAIYRGPAAVRSAADAARILLGAERRI